MESMGIPDHLNCLLRNLYAGQEETVRTLYGTTDWFKIEKGVRQALCCHSVCLIYMLSTLRNASWMSYKLESRQMGETSTASDIHWIPL